MGRQRFHPAALLPLLLLAARPAAAFTHYDNACHIVGDTDIYGIGVRIGYYLTWFAAVLAVGINSNKGITDTLKAVNVMFCAVLIVLIRNVGLGSFAVLEWQIAVGLVLILPLSPLIFAFILGGPGLASWGVLFVLYGLYACLLPWLFWMKLDQGRHVHCPEVRMWIFASFDFYNTHYIKFLKALSIIACFGGAFIVVLGLYLIYSRMDGNRTLADTWIAEKVKENTDAPAPSSEDTSGARLVLVLLFLFGGGLTIATTEKIIHLNQIDLSDANFSNTGQLIPFLVGLFAVISTIFSGMFDRDEKPESSAARRANRYP
ncbi:hypothetical protein SPI_06395 [Niveomyces insectorum RCEF 264]|uniref:Uncharacterized protein n=1 Tax=Niveomyces insectorum RCEF 264 TaxID=1081102 RepID=A0A167S3G8_9HYPO|nr:hypothetical protein SPI_06395 [Niveomyces insectorum RCEF 264]